MRMQTKAIIVDNLRWTNQPTCSSENLSECDDNDPELSVSPRLLSEDFLLHNQLRRSIYKQSATTYLLKSITWQTPHLPYKELTFPQHTAKKHIIWNQNSSHNLKLHKLKQPHDSKQSKNH